MTIRIAPVRIAMWSGPRNLSTAMMRSFGARADTVVSDEPFYGAYLHHTGDDQAMKEQVIASMDCDWASVARAQNGEFGIGAAKEGQGPDRLRAGRQGCRRGAQGLGFG